MDTTFNIGCREFHGRLIQGPLAGFSAAPMRQLYYQFTAPAYSVSEMLSAHDVIHKHHTDSRYLYRGPEEKFLCYQLAGREPQLMAAAAKRLENMGADLIDINCGCPKTKIRKKGAGSALLDYPNELYQIISSVREAINIPLTVKIRIHSDERDFQLAKGIEQAGADALIVHGRRRIDDYDTPCDMHQIRLIKESIRIPVIANGDISDLSSLERAMSISGCDAYMISRAGCGQPWLYQQLLGNPLNVSMPMRLDCFMTHLLDLAKLEDEYQAVLQSRKLVRYYFRGWLNAEQLQIYYSLKNLKDIYNYAAKIEFYPRGSDKDLS